MDGWHELRERLREVEAVVALHDSYVWGEAAPHKKPEWLKRWADRVKEEDNQCQD